MITLSNALDANGYQVKNVGLPTDPGDVVTKAFAEQLLNNRTWKDPVRVAVGSNVSVAAPGSSLDGVAMNAGDSVLLYGQTAQAENGAYTWNGPSIPMTRRTDSDTGTEVRPGTTYPVTEGTSADRYAILITDGVVTIGTTALGFLIMSNTGQTYGATNGVQLANGNFSLLLDTNSGLIVTASGLKIDPSVLARKYATNIGNGSATMIQVVHNLGTRDVVTGLYHIATGRKWVEDLELVDANTFNLHFGAAPASSALRLAVQG